MSPKQPLIPDDDEAEACGRTSFASPPCFMHELDPAWLEASPGLNAGKRATNLLPESTGANMVKETSAPSCKATQER